MAMTFRYDPAPNGVVFSAVEDRGGFFEIELTRREAAEVVANLCKAARLPEPWKGN